LWGIIQRSTIGMVLKNRNYMIDIWEIGLFKEVYDEL